MIYKGGTIMATVYYESLSPEIKKGMKEMRFSADELEVLYAKIMTRRAELMKGFKRAAIMLGVIGVLMAAMTVMSMGKVPNADPTLGIVIAVGLVLFMGLVLLFVKLLCVDRVRNQFMSLMKKYYPQFVHLMGKK